jgi:hypothetical protein
LSRALERDPARFVVALLLGVVVAERQCPVCGRRFYPRTGQHTYCRPSCRELAKEAKRSSPARRARYGFDHQKARAAWAPLVEAGGVKCARCLEPILPWHRWDLGHDDEHRAGGTGGPIGLHPEHRVCNRATSSHASNGRDVVRKDVERRYSQAGLDPGLARFDSTGYPEDDAEHGVFWGPPGSGSVRGAPLRWSQPWFDWRGDREE